MGLNKVNYFFVCSNEHEVNSLMENSERVAEKLKRLLHKHRNLHNDILVTCDKCYADGAAMICAYLIKCKNESVTDAIEIFQKGTELDLSKSLGEEEFAFLKVYLER